MSSKPGQKHPTPTPGHGDRVFYQSLLKQRPDSEMAQEWCLAYGVLSHKKAEKLSIIVNDRKRQQRMGNTVAGKKKSKASSPAPKKKKAKIKMESAVASPVKSGII